MSSEWEFFGLNVLNVYFYLSVNLRKNKLNKMNNKQFMKRTNHSMSVKYVDDDRHMIREIWILHYSLKRRKEVATYWKLSISMIHMLEDFSFLDKIFVFSADKPLFDIFCLLQYLFPCNTLVLWHRETSFITLTQFLWFSLQVYRIYAKVLMLQTAFWCDSA